MKEFLRNHDLRLPLLALLGASALGTMLVGTRAILTGHRLQFFLVWNLFLAWLPLLLALGLETLARRRMGTAGFWLIAGAWLLFFPNAPYIVTDLTHLELPIRSRWWTDLILIMLFAITGMVLAFISLHRMQGLVVRRHGPVAGWMFVLGVAFVSAFGVYIGRFERWNSWDVVTSPMALLSDSVHWVHRHSFRFTVLFGLFLAVVYALLYSLTCLGGTGRRTNQRHEV